MREGLVRPESLAQLDDVELLQALRPLWEEAGPLVGRLAGRPFASWTEVMDAAEQEVAAMSETERGELLQAHPRLGEVPSTLRSRSETSWREQGGARSADETTSRLWGELNDRYERTFGFPFVEWVAGRPLEMIVPVIRARLRRDRATELAAGCAALIAIARDRLRRAGTV